MSFETVPMAETRIVRVPAALGAEDLERSAVMAPPARVSTVSEPAGAGALEERLFYSTPVRPNGPLPTDHFVGGPLANDGGTQDGGAYAARPLSYGPVS
jgi:hypothetical protein